MMSPTTKPEYAVTTVIDGIIWIVRTSRRKLTEDYKLVMKNGSAPNADRDPKQPTADSEENEVT